MKEMTFSLLLLLLISVAGMKCIVYSIAFAFALLQVHGKGHERLLQDRPRVSPSSLNNPQTSTPAPNDPAVNEDLQSTLPPELLGILFNIPSTTARPSTSPMPIFRGRNSGRPTQQPTEERMAPAEESMTQDTNCELLLNTQLRSRASLSVALARCGPTLIS